MRFTTIVLLGCLLSSVLTAWNYKIANCKGDKGEFFKVNNYSISGKISPGEKVVLSVDVTFLKSAIIKTIEHTAWINNVETDKGTQQVFIPAKQGDFQTELPLTLPETTPESWYKIQMVYYDIKSKLQCVDIQILIL